jgi:hypothetical protein
MLRDVLENLKKGLLLGAKQKANQGQDILRQLKDVYESGDFSLSTMEQGVECEFQWLLCQQYTVQNIRLEDAWAKFIEQPIHCTKRPAMHSASNEYSGENILHLLIVQGGCAEAHISRLFQMVTLQRYKMSLLCAEVRSVSRHALKPEIMFSGFQPFFLPCIRQWCGQVRSHPVSLCCLHWSGIRCATAAPPVPEQQTATFSFMDKRQYW